MRTASAVLALTAILCTAAPAAGTAQAAPTKTYTAQGPVAMRVGAVASAKVVRTLPPGAVVYPTGKKSGLWWEVSDENDNTGWVLNTRLAPTQ